MGGEGHFELVKLNLDNPAVRDHLLDAVGMWMEEFGIDGIRLDVAYMLNRTFMKNLVDFARDRNPEMVFIGEMLHGDYSTLVNHHMLDSATNYECYKGLYSSFNTHNMHEIGYSLNRQFGPEPWTLYQGLPLYSFVDNHDVMRIATQLTDEKHLPLINALMFAMPGVPSVYYGSEWGIEGFKEPGSDDALRPRVKPEDLKRGELYQYIAKLSEVRKHSQALKDGGYREIRTEQDIIAFEREAGEERMIFALNAGSEEYTLHFDARAGKGTDLLTGEEKDFGGGLLIPPYQAMIIQPER